MSGRRGLPAADLADAFRRSAEPAPVPAIPPMSLAKEPDRAAPRSDADPKPATDRARPAPPVRPTPPITAAPVETPAPATGRLVLWTPTVIRARMQAMRASSGTLYRDQVLDALEATVDELPALLRERDDAAPRGRLFERRASVRRPSAGPRVQLTIGGFLSSQLDVIDDLVASTGASSRSALVNVALDAYLPRRD